MGGGNGGLGGREFSNQSAYGFMAPPDWTGLQNYLNFDIDKSLGDDLLDPNLDYQFADTSRALKEAYGSPYGSELSPTEQKENYTQAISKLGEQRGVATQQAAKERRQAKTAAELARLQFGAGITAPQLVKTGESGVIPNPDGGFLGAFKKSLGNTLGQFI